MSSINKFEINGQEVLIDDSKLTELGSEVSYRTRRLVKFPALQYNITLGDKDAGELYWENRVTTDFINRGVVYSENSVRFRIYYYDENFSFMSFDDYVSSDYMTLNVEKSLEIKKAKYIRLVFDTTITIIEDLKYANGYLNEHVKEIDNQVNQNSARNIFGEAYLRNGYSLLDNGIVTQYENRASSDFLNAGFIVSEHPSSYRLWFYDENQNFLQSNNYTDVDVLYLEVQKLLDENKASYLKIVFDTTKTNIEKIRIGELSVTEQVKNDYKIINVSIWGSILGGLNLGEIGYNTGTKLLRKKMSSDTYITIPYRKDALYIYNGIFYLYDDSSGQLTEYKGKELIEGFNKNWYLDTAFELYYKDKILRVKGGKPYNIYTQRKIYTFYEFDKVFDIYSANYYTITISKSGELKVTEGAIDVNGEDIYLGYIVVSFDKNKIVRSQLNGLYYINGLLYDNGCLVTNYNNEYCINNYTPVLKEGITLGDIYADELDWEDRVTTGFIDNGIVRSNSAVRYRVYFYKKDLSFISFADYVSAEYLTLNIERELEIKSAGYVRLVFDTTVTNISDVEFKTFNKNNSSELKYIDGSGVVGVEVGDREKKIVSSLATIINESPHANIFLVNNFYADYGDKTKNAKRRMFKGVLMCLSEILSLHFIDLTKSGIRDTRENIYYTVDGIHAYTEEGAEKIYGIIKSELCQVYGLDMTELSSKRVLILGDSSCSQTSEYNNYPIWTKLLANDVLYVQNNAIPGSSWSLNNGYDVIDQYENLETKDYDIIIITAGGNELYNYVANYQTMCQYLINEGY